MPHNHSRNAIPFQEIAHLRAHISMTLPLESTRRIPRLTGTVYRQYLSLFKADGLLHRVSEHPRSERLVPLLVYSVLALALLGPGLLPGYILRMDLVFGPDMSATDVLYGVQSSAWASLPYRLALDGLTWVFPSWVVQKAILFLVLALAGLGAHRLFPLAGVGKFYAGLLYVVNPFTHIRLLAGQWGFLAAYAVFPFAVQAFLDLLDKGGARRILVVALLSTLVGVFQIHGFLLLFIIFLALTVAHLFNGGFQAQIVTQVSKRVALTSVVFVALNLFWIFPVLEGVDSDIPGIGSNAFEAFAPVSSAGLGVIAEVGAMYGFWSAESLPDRSRDAIWYLPFVFILFLSVLGLAAGQTAKHLGHVAIGFAVASMVAFVLAMGASTQFSSWFFEPLWDHMPFFKGFQDPHKFVLLMALSYSYLGGLGVWYLMQSARSLSRGWVVFATSALVLALPIVYSWPMFGLSGDLRPTSYPKEWYEARDLLSTGSRDSNVLVFPWHQYMDYSWLPNDQKTLSNPAKVFFGQRAITGDNLEAGSIYTQSTEPLSRYIEFFLGKGQGSELDNFGEILAPIDVEYVVLFHEADYESYSFLNDQPDLELLSSNDRISIYRNTHQISRLYAVDQVTYVENLNHFLELSRSQDVMERVYVIGAGQNQGQPKAMEAITADQESPGSIRVAGSNSKFEVMTIRQGLDRAGWELDGESEVFQNLGISPVFLATGEPGKIRFAEYYRTQIWVQIISMMTFLGSITFLVAGRRFPVKQTSLRSWFRIPLPRRFGS